MIISLVITTIYPPSEILNRQAAKCLADGIYFIVIGDKKTPKNFTLPDSDFWDLQKQHKSGFRLAKSLPENHYARKNLGYLIAIKNKSDIIFETDDDNIPRENSWGQRSPFTDGKLVQDCGWINIYSFFSDAKIWPRGFPLEFISEQINYNTIVKERVFCPIQQGLANDNPDVDAVYRLTNSLPIKFLNNSNIILGTNSWSPFNSQNTAWFKPAFPLLYLPSRCNFRMTDIWRSFIAQRIAWEYKWCIAYHAPNVSQVRNEHDFLKDFENEIPGYLNNKKICTELESLHLSKKECEIYNNLRKCYESIIKLELIDKEELVILEDWIDDLIELNIDFTTKFA